MMAMLMIVTIFLLLLISYHIAKAVILLQKIYHEVDKIENVVHREEKRRIAKG